LAARKEIIGVEDVDTVQLTIAVFERDYGAKYAKAVKKIVDDTDVLFEHVRYPDEHWVRASTGGTDLGRPAAQLNSIVSRLSAVTSTASTCRRAWWGSASLTDFHPHSKCRGTL